MDQRIEALVRAHARGDSERFYAVALAYAASLARHGAYGQAQELKDAIDRGRARADLPSFSGQRPSCPKCALAAGEADSKVVYLREGGAEFLERTCWRCGYLWYELCADNKA